jgi:hypothetical protein
LRPLISIEAVRERSDRIALEKMALFGFQAYAML